LPRTDKNAVHLHLDFDGVEALSGGILERRRVMRWTLTIKDQTFGVHTAINRYECRVARSGSDVRLSFQNLSSGNAREGRFLMPAGVARRLANALLLASAEEDEQVDVVFVIDEGKAKG
jgi:hypothetical protein